MLLKSACCEDSCAPTPVSATTRVEMTTDQKVDTLILVPSPARRLIYQNYFNKIITISCCPKCRTAIDFKIVLGVNAFYGIVIWASMQAEEHRKRWAGGRKRKNKKKSHN